MKLYKQTVNGIEHTFQLSDEDAKARGLTSADQVEDAVEDATPLEFGTPTTDGQDVEQNVKADLEAKQATAPRNKARRAADTDEK